MDAYGGGKMVRREATDDTLKSNLHGSLFERARVG